MNLDTDKGRRVWRIVNQMHWDKNHDNLCLYAILRLKNEQNIDWKYKNQYENLSKICLAFIAKPQAFM